MLQQQLKPLRPPFELQIDGDFIIVNPNSNITTLEDLEGHRICGTSNSLQAFLSRSGVQNVTHKAIWIEESVAALERGVCDAIIANSTDLQKIRRSISERNQFFKFKIIFFQ